MADLTKALEVEKLSESNLLHNQNRRSAVLAVTKTDTPSEKGLHRQLVDNNDVRNYLEETLLQINAMVAEADESET